MQKLVSVVLAVFVAAALPASAKDYAAGGLKILHPWSRPTPPGAPTGVGYLAIANEGPAPDRLIGASSPAAAKVEVHEMSMAGGVMRMRPVAGGLAVPAGGKLELGPSGYHLMLIGLKAPLAAGAQVPVTLRFEKAGAMPIALSVEAAR